MILKLLLISLICVLIIDISGIIESIKTFLSKLLKCEWYQITIKPFDCSFCMNFWCSLVYIMYNNSINLEYLFIILVFSGLTPIFKEVWLTISDLLLKILKLLQ